MAVEYTGHVIQMDTRPVYYTATWLKIQIFKIIYIWIFPGTMWVATGLFTVNVDEILSNYSFKSYVSDSQQYPLNLWQSINEVNIIS